MRSQAARSHDGPAPEATRGRGLDALLDRVAVGDVEAFEQLYDEVAPRVYGICLLVLGNGRAAQDTAEAVLLDIWRSPERGANADALAWLLHRAHDQAVAAVRNRSALRLGSATHEQDLPPASPKNTRPPEEMLSCLTPAQRAVVMGAYCSGLNLSALSAKLNVEPSAVASLARDALCGLAAPAKRR